MLDRCFLTHQYLYKFLWFMKQVICFINILFTKKKAAPNGAAFV